MPSALITAKGQTTIPKAIRDRLRVAPGDRIDFVVQADGTVTVEPANQGVTPLKGLLATKGQRPVSVAAMHAVIRRRAAGR
ncbi:MAG: type II toxin-antitoxin system PrlF family antitoxin [Vicinamibacterales bacterium]|jgi:antitoxin PrlF